MRKPLRPAAIVTACGIAGLLAGPRVLAQTGSLERLEITGSFLRRIDAETALPVTVIRVDELRRAGVTNGEEAVLYITQQQGGVTTSGTISQNNGAAAYPNLRALGTRRTLVLLNGLRIVMNPFDVANVNLNSLPLSAVDRIEVLSDGASSIYGTDAIAGVINFITRRRYEGATADARTQITEGGGGNVHTAGLVGGFGDFAAQGWNLFASLGARKQEPMRATQRPFSATQYIPQRGLDVTNPTTSPANYSQAVNGVTTVAAANPASPACDPALGSISVPEPSGARVRCFTDTQLYNVPVPDQQQLSAFVRGTLALGPDHRAWAEFFRVDSRVVIGLAPSPESGLVLAPDSPYFPGNGIYPAAPGLDRTKPISLNWRTTPLGPRISNRNSTTQRAVVGAEGSLSAWDYNATVLWSKADYDRNLISGYPGTAVLRNGLRGCTLTAAAAASPCGAPLGLYLNPFGPQTAAAQSYFEAGQVYGRTQQADATLASAQLTARRDLFQMPGGPAALALSVEARREDNDFLPLITEGGSPSTDPVREGARNVQAFAAETNLPVTRNLEINFSARYDRYSDFGSTTNPKAAVRWRAADNFLVRASYNKGFATPSLSQLYAPQDTATTQGRYSDPVLCPGGVVNAALGGQPSRDCNVQFSRLVGGNPDLTPEKSTAHSIGFVVQPSAQWSFGIDLWSYYVRNSISSGLSETAVFGNPAKYADLFVRCSARTNPRFTPARCLQPGGDPLAWIVVTNLNLGDYRTRGVDLQVDYKGAPTVAGRFSASVRGSYVSRYEFQLEPGGAWFNPVGNYSAEFGGPVLRYQQVATLGWQKGAWSAQLTNRYLSGYTDQNGTSVAPAFRDNRVRAYSLWNISASWKATPAMTLHASVLNVLNTDPPFTNQTNRFNAVGFDDRFHNPLGRTWLLAARYEF